MLARHSRTLQHSTLARVAVDRNELIFSAHTVLQVGNVRTATWHDLTTNRREKVVLKRIRIRHRKRGASSARGADQREDC